MNGCKKVTIGQSADTFATLIVEDTTGLQTEIDMGVDWRAHPAPLLEVGPVLHQNDVVAAKTLAVFGRGYLRDLLDLDSILSSKKYSINDLMKLAAEYDPGFEPRYFHNSIIGGVGYDAESAEPYGVTARQWEDIKQRLLVAADEVVLYIVATSNPETLSDEDIAIIDALTDRSLVADDQQVVPPVRGVTHSQLDYKEHKSDHLMRDQENEL